MFKFSNRVLSEGSHMMHSTYDPDDYIKSVERNVEARGIKPRKKNDSSKDYDKVETFQPRIFHTDRNFNKFSEIKRSILKNMREGTAFLENGDSFDFYGLGICGNVFVSNSHYFRRDFHSVHMRSFNSRGNYRIFLKTSLQIDHKGNDVCIVRFPSYLFSDIRWAIPDVVPSRTIKGEFDSKSVDITFNSTKLDVSDDVQPYTLTSFYSYICDHSNGQCGLPLFGFVGDKKYLLGLHSAGGYYDAYGFSFSLTKDLFAGYSVVSEGSIRLPYNTPKIVETRNTSPFLYEDVTSLNVLGSIDNSVTVTPKSRLVRTKIYSNLDNLLEMPCDKIYGIPLMRSKRSSTNEFISPYNNWLNKFSVKRELDVTKCSEVSDFMALRFCTMLDDDWKPVPLEEAFHGSSDNFYFRSVNTKTSAGYFFPGSKRSFIEDDMPNDEIKQQISEQIKAYYRDECAHPILGAQLKDEPRSYAKCLSGNTRVFAMSSFDSILLNRMFLSNIYTRMISESNVFRTALGFNMHSDIADTMYKDLLKFDNYFVGDYGGYDTSMPTMVSNSINDMIVRVHENKGYNRDAIKILRGILTDNTYPILSIQGNLSCFPGFQPSGKYGTAEDNSLRGLFLLLYFFNDVFVRSGRYCLDDFFSLTCFYIYGDDLVGSVSDEISDEFNCIAYSKFCHNIYGMKFTDADKKPHTRNFVERDELSFLKRSFKYHKDLDRFVAVLDRESFIKAIGFSLESKIVSLDDQLVESCGAVLREFFFHLDDEETYNRKREQFITLLLDKKVSYKKDLEEYFPNYSFLLDYYKV